MFAQRLVHTLRLVLFQYPCQLLYRGIYASTIIHNIETIHCGSVWPKHQRLENLWSERTLTSALVPVVQLPSFDYDHTKNYNNNNENSYDQCCWRGYCNSFNVCSHWNIEKQTTYQHALLITYIVKLAPIVHNDRQCIQSITKGWYDYYIKYAFHTKNRTTAF